MIITFFESNVWLFNATFIQTCTGIAVAKFVTHYKLFPHFVSAPDIQVDETTAVNEPLTEKKKNRRGRSKLTTDYIGIFFSISVWWHEIYSQLVLLSKEHFEMYIPKLTSLS